MPIYSEVNSKYLKVTHSKYDFAYISLPSPAKNFDNLFKALRILSNNNKTFSIVLTIPKESHLLIDKIKSDLNIILNNPKHKKKKIYLHVHPFVAAYLNQGITSIKFNWWIKFKKRIKVIPRDAYRYLQYKFIDGKNRSLRI